MATGEDSEKPAAVTLPLAGWRSADRATRLLVLLVLLLLREADQRMVLQEPTASPVDFTLSRGGRLLLGRRFWPRGLSPTAHCSTGRWAAVASCTNRFIVVVLIVDACK